MDIVLVNEKNWPLYLQLVQYYEAEFSAITQKKPNAQGLFELDVQPGPEVNGYLLLIDGLPAGLAAIKTIQTHQYEVCEFYIIPSFRQQGLGRHFAHGIWKSSPGEWQVKQIQGAAYATLFWRKVINDFSLADFYEDQYMDAYWGQVTRQTFHVVS